MIRPQLILDVNNEIIVDNFAGGGGASHGIEQALGRHVDVAINHDPMAIALHSANHPQTKHLCEDVFKVDPLKATNRRPVGLGWFSPDCKHFSKAKGGKPRSKKIRGLAWIVIKWVRAYHDAKLPLPRVIVLENVEEFQDWGPVLDNGEPCPRRKGATFKSWVKQLRGFGYTVEWREMRACDFGAPTIRKRLYLIARCDGKPIVWPEPTHANPHSPGFKGSGLKPWRTAAECIDWSIPCHSIFLTKKEGRAVGVKRPLAEATMRRLARGVFKFVLNAKEPFIVPLTHQGSDRVEAASEPFRTITGAHRGEKAVAVPYVAGCGGRMGQSPERPADKPMQTITAKADAVLSVPVMTGAGGPTYGGKPRSADQPMHTLTTENHQALALPLLTEHANASNQRTFDIDEPLRTQCAEVKGGHFALVNAFLAKHCGVTGSKVDEPIGTITSVAGAGHALGIQAAHLSKFYGTNVGQHPDKPLPTITAQGNHIAQVMAFLMKYYSEGGQDQDMREPMHTIVTKARLGLVTIYKELYQLVDILMRMLVPRELYRGQGFPDSYIIEIEIDAIRNGKPRRVKLSQEAQVRMCGNSVCPPVAEAIVRANVPELSAYHKGERRKVKRKLSSVTA